MAEELRYSTAREDDTTRVAVLGDLDMGGTLRLEQELDRVLGERPARLVIDLSGATFVDSSGLNLLLATEERARERGIGMELVPGPREVMQVFRTSGLADVLPFREAE